MEERVAITGIGVLSVLGKNREALAAGLETGQGVFVEEECAPGEGRMVGRVGDVTPTSVRLQSSKASQIDLVSRYAVEATAQALKDAAVEFTDELRERAGVLLGTTFGCFESNILFDQYYQTPEGRLMNVSPLYFKSTVANAAAGWVSILLKLKGVNATFVSGNIGSAEAIGHAFDLIRDGLTDLICAGGMDRVLPLNILLDPPAEGVPSEGAGVVALESMSRAVTRGARIYGRVHGYTRRLCRNGDEAWLVQQTLEELHLKPSQLATVVVAHASPESVAKVTADLRTAGIHADVWALKQQLGECYGAWTGLAVASAALRLEQLPASAPYLAIVTLDPGQEAICTVLRKA